MNRVLYYRRCHAKHSLISPNKNINVLNEKVEALCNEAGSYNPSSSLESNLQSVYQYVEQRNPHLLDRSSYSPEQIQKLAKYGEFCNSLYHDKKIMMIQVRIQFIFHSSATGRHHSKPSLEPSLRAGHFSDRVASERNRYHAPLQRGGCVPISTKRMICLSFSMASC